MKSYMDMGYHSHTETEIKGFFGPYRWLSNFHLCPVVYNGIEFQSSENAYQAAKSVNLVGMYEFVNITPAEARKLGQKITLRNDWEAAKLDCMAAILFDKFWRNKDVRAKLIATRGAYLEETNHWGDTFWGVDIKKGGKNHLGEILMNLRLFFTKVENA